MSRALLVAFPPTRPEAVALLDVTERRITTFVGKEELAALHSRLSAYEIIGAVDVRGLLSVLGFEPGDRRLAELGPPQKTKALGPRRTLKVTLGLLVQGSCGIVRPFGEEGALARYLAKGELQKLRRRLEMDVRSLYALYEYGRVHGAVRLRWGPVDERVPVPWIHRDELRLYGLQRSALAKGVALQVVAGNAPALEDPWARAQLAFVAQGEHSWDRWLVDEGGYEIYEPEIQRARLAVEVH